MRSGKSAPRTIGASEASASRLDEGAVRGELRRNARSNVLADLVDRLENPGFWGAGECG